MPSSSGNLAQYFANAKIVQPKDCLDPANFPTTSQAIDAQDEEHFESTSFKLKRTRSMGLLDEFIAPTRALLEEQQASKQLALEQERRQRQPQLQQNSSQTPSLDSLLGADDDDENQFIENVDDLPKMQSNNTRAKNIIYDYDEDMNTDENRNYNDEDYNSNSYNDENEDFNKNRSGSGSGLSPPDSPEHYQPHDDNDIAYEPSSHVDYLSHNWKEADISKSWRYIVLRRKDVANSARLENASWRTWAQAKYHLKTISPESVNWLKDSDVTWLYGPLYAEPQSGSLYGGGTSDDFGLSYHTVESTKACLKLAGKDEDATVVVGPKPILKKRTVGEMFSQPSTIKIPAQHQHHHASPPVYEDDFNEISRKVNAQYKPQNADESSELSQANSPLINSASTSNVFSNSPALTSPISSGQNALSNSMSASNSPGPRANLTPAPSIQTPQPVKRHIHFNDRVEQCIALRYPESEPEYEDGEYSDEDQDIDQYDDYSEDEQADDYDDEEEEEEDESDDEGGFFLSVKSQSSVHLPTTFQTTTPLDSKDQDDKYRQDQEHDHEHDHDHTESNVMMVNGRAVLKKTIEILPATTLNYGSDHEEDQDLVSQSTLSHNTNTLRGYNYYHYDYNSVFTAENHHIPPMCNNVDDFQHQDDQGFEIVQDVDDILMDGDSSGDAVMDVPEGIVLGSSVAAAAAAASTSPEQHAVPSLSNTKLTKSGSSQANLNQQVWGGNILKGSASNLQNQQHVQPQSQSRTSLLDQWEQSAGAGKSSQSNLSAQFKSFGSNIRHDNLDSAENSIPRKKSSSSGFQFNQNSSDDSDGSDDSEDEEEPVAKPFNTAITHPHLFSSTPPVAINQPYRPPSSPTMGGSIRRVTSGSSSASLSEIAARGFISRGKDSEDMTDLQQSFSHLNNNANGNNNSDSGSPANNNNVSTAALGSFENNGNNTDGRTGLSFKNKLLNSWGRK
ncbi:hypothetical protein WICPIJ_002822 [Wickerhamomyces pijperi]|uniref:Nitrogen regulatory protein areA GATA-like domain-containing protein n=1 Tax=Wickerhamomyces pijperi TaxID=599730 RepID=A0A9P8Q8U5_WICPI|nr:hypothetical protein WICPIJ_002822 [Wickerhamomyces pijperi]